MSMAPIAVTGAQGQLGSELCRQLGAAAAPLDLPTFDLADSTLVRRVLTELRARAIINCAAYTAVDQAERESETCYTINAEAVGVLASTAETLGCPLVQISTDYVFDGVTGRDVPLREDETPTAARGVYAQSKLRGEQLARRWPRHFVVRTCGLYGFGERGGNFVETMLRLGNERARLRVVNDQHCTPTYAAHLASAVLYLLRAEAPFGTYHVVNAGSTTWYDFACEIFRQASVDVEVLPVSTDEYQAAAPRPCYSVLDTGKYNALGGPRLPPWPEALAQYLARRANVSSSRSASS
jgi:dTDP-4-dehydrorhamnose reductase